MTNREREKIMHALRDARKACGEIDELAAWAICAFRVAHVAGLNWPDVRAFCGDVARDEQIGAGDL